jgi:SEL1 protein
LTEWLSAFLEAELANWDDYEPDDYDAAQHDDYYHAADIDSDILESLAILALSGALAFLLYYRAQRQRRGEEERRREELRQQVAGLDAGGQDRGVFPREGDPGWMDWVAGGVGH